ncbi:MAG: hypothetical protein ACC682_05335 [Gemmatimonadota bacterium]
MSARRGANAFMVIGTAFTASACESEPFTPPPGFESPSPGAVLNLAVGERITLSASAIRGSLEIPGADASRSYLFVIHDVRSEQGGPTDVRMEVTRVLATLSREPPSRVRTTSSDAGGSVPRRAGARSDDPFDRWFTTGESDFRTRVAADLRRASARSAEPRSSGFDPGVRASMAASVPKTGELLEFGSPVEADGSLATCTSQSRVTGRVRAVGPHFAIVEDTLVAGPFTSTDFAELLAEIETVAYPVDSAYFGTPHDIDANGRVILLMSGEVNRLGAAGFFTSSDLALKEDCPTSNEGEVLWMLAPDPARQFGFDPIPTDLIRARIAGVVVHELQHLIHLERRVYESGGGLDSADLVWLNEGLSHIAEEVAGLFAGGLRTGQNYALPDLPTSEGRERFERYHLNDFRFMREYFQDTGGVPLLLDGQVTRGQLQKARGFGYLFLRWLADQYAGGGAPGLVGTEREQAFFRSLAIGGPDLRQSVENILGRLSELGIDESWEALFSAYVAAPALDDLTQGFNLETELQILSWDFPQAYETASRNGFLLDFPSGFPLDPKLILLRTIPFIGFRDDFTLLPSTAAYFRLEGAFATPVSRVAVTGLDGRALPPERDVLITIVRTL